MASAAAGKAAAGKAAPCSTSFNSISCSLAIPVKTPDVKHCFHETQRKTWLFLPVFSLPPPRESCLALTSPHHFLSLIDRLQAGLVSKQHISHSFCVSRLLQEGNTAFCCIFFPLLKCREERLHQGSYPAGIVLGERVAGKPSC